MTAPDGSNGISARIARFACNDDNMRIPANARAIARLCVLDWCAVAAAGRDEPVARIVRAMAAEEGGAPQASVIGLEQKRPARAAALANGAASHALDYDDTHFDYIGHTSVAVLPAVLALAEKRGASGAELIEAFLIGAETACRIGRYLGSPHYQHGFHQTATSGCFGATAAAARLMRLSIDQTHHALGIAATRASGLKSQFGTMGKPYHAGMAAANAVEAATLASLGFISRTDGLECSQGFIETHAGAGGDIDAIFAGLGETYRFERVQYKYHACCHGTHAALEALKAARGESVIDPAAVDAITLTVHPRWLRVCHILEPRTGLEAKFSFRLTAAMLMAGIDTAALDAFDDAACARPDLLRLRDTVSVITDERLGDTEAKALVQLKSGVAVERHADLDRPLTADAQAPKVIAKARALLGARHADALWGVISQIEQRDTAALIAVLRSAAGAARR